MDIRVSGHQMDTGAALQDHVSDRLSAIVEKYFGRAISSQVTFGKAPAGMYSCDIVTHVMQGLILKANAVAQDAHVALDQAAEKIDKQLRRYKRRLNDRHEQTAHALREEEASYRIFAAPDADVEIDHDEQDDDAGAPAIIAETTADIPEASVADAVMMLDLRHTNALLFKNAGTGRHNMVYRRNDGSIGWVEPR
ncbi:ribosome-associated translation inhibitor RaiA [Altererythrobacter sp. H2]|uniref:ribosome hibernation-promoting factor, HPF/YfiA family n=1 Tax=Altererythrobacter sp. H2 TaxID=3108391 RepID=UPI000BD41731|nr:ribosome-associated translation inhibitor RaiA [Altererythrobacter sp. H2]OZA94014.1 MAG: ribosomal subunit interface protein [Erythrobacter sp. 34-65-8]WRK96060.1 ribosome-associated translation inhibitor RaiA [Altererythrobacter sp. H2]